MLKFVEERSSCYNHLECSEACKSRGILVHYTSVYYLINVHVVLLMCVPHSLAWNNFIGPNDNDFSVYVSTYIDLIMCPGRCGTCTSII